MTLFSFSEFNLTARVYKVEDNKTNIQISLAAIISPWDTCTIKQTGCRCKPFGVITTEWPNTTSIQMIDKP